MNLGIVLASLLFFIILSALVSWLVLFFQFCHSREKRWATQVLHLLREAENCFYSEKRQLRELRTERDAKARSLREETFAAHLSDYSVDELEAYPGIGPGTVAKLRAAGLVNLARLHRAHIHIHGLGEKRLADISYAVRNLLGKARNTFDAGNCKQFHELAAQLKTLSTRYDRLEAEASTCAKAGEEFIDRLGEAVEYARAVTFWRWFRPISRQVLVPSEVLEAPLPDLEAALQAAEQPSARCETARRSTKGVRMAAAAPQVVSQPASPVLAAPPSPPLVSSPPPVRPATPPLKPAGPTKEECLSLLEIPAQTPLTVDLVRRQWNLLSCRLDPQKVAAMGTEFVELAQEKLAALRRAAESLLEPMGEKLETNPPPAVQDLRHNPDLDDVFGGM